MEIALQHRSRIVVLAALAMAAAVLMLVAMPAGGAVPSSARVGRVSYMDISGSTDLATSIRSFSMQTSSSVLPGQGSGGGTGKAAFGAPRVVQDVVGGSPMILAALAAGRTLTSITVVLYHPDSTTAFQRWVFTDAVLTLDDQVQKGPASAASRETVSWAYDTVTQTTYAANGTTVTGTTCFDVALGAACAAP